MSKIITNFDDIIDSRDVINRIEELESIREPWRVGWNMPGYLPDSEPSDFQDWTDACAALAETMRQHANDEDDDESEIAIALQNAADKIEIGDIQDETEFGITIGSYHYWIVRAENEGLSDDDYEELCALRALAEQGEDSPDWTYGETLIRDSYFVEYAQDLAEDCGMIPHNLQWPCHCIDWDKAARELQMDYMCVDFDGVRYWIHA